MPLTPTKKLTLAASIAVLVLAALILARHFSIGSADSARQQLLQFVPSDSTAVIFLDVDECKQSPFLQKLYEWAPHPTEDSEYAQFVRDTGFSYERDLRRAVVAISNQGATTNLLAIADGNFERRKIETFLNHNGKSLQHGKWKIFRLNDSMRGNDRPLSFVFLSDHRIAITDSENFPLTLFTSAAEANHAEWNLRFDRLAGTPIFALIRQDPAFQSALNSAAPGGFRSPQLSGLLEQLQWISIAGKPQADQLRVVAEGECLSDQSISQLNDVVQGVFVLAQNGLNDPKLRQQMNPAEREAYLEILKSADIQKFDRGEWKTVRLVLSITPKFLDVVRVASFDAPKRETPPPATETNVPAKSKTRKKN
jgi:hypothetical protein